MLQLSTWAIALAGFTSSAWAAAPAAATAAAPAAAAGVMFTNPTSNSVWAHSVGQKVAWTKPGPNDPTAITLLLIAALNKTLLPEPFMPLIENYPTSKLSLTLTENIQPGNDYTILMVDPNDHSTIYAQGGRFNVTGGAPGFNGFSLASADIASASASAVSAAQAALAAGSSTIIVNGVSEAVTAFAAANGLSVPSPTLAPSAVVAAVSPTPTTGSTTTTTTPAHNSAFAVTGNMSLVASLIAAISMWIMA